MDAIEATKLLAHAAAFDNRKPSKAASIAWAEALKDIPADPDAFGAVARFYSKPTTDGNLDGTRWIQPHHVRQLRKEIRGERTPMPDSVPYPALGEDETGTAFVARRRAQLHAVADGRLQVQPIRQLTGGPHPSVAKTLSGVGQLPAHVREALAAALPGRAAREAAHESGSPDVLSVACPWCQAGIGQPCKRRSDKRETWHHRRAPHPSRVDAAVVATAVCPACQVEPGTPCRTDTGQPYPGIHPQRSAYPIGSVA